MSDESDREDCTASERDELDELDELDDYGSDESGSDSVNGLLDIEAIESDGGSDEGTDDGSYDEAEPLFPQFCRLPIELREQVWEFFDPNLKAKARVFDVVLIDRPHDLWSGPTLDSRTEPSRTMMATHRESRALALKHYPDILHLYQGRSIVRYNSEQDMILIWGKFYVPGTMRNVLEANLLAGVKLIGMEWMLDGPWEELPAENTLELEEEFSVRIYNCFDADSFRSYLLQPFVSDAARKVYVQTKEGDLDEELEYMYCWLDEPLGERRIEEGYNPRDMIEFCYTQGIQRFDKIRKATLMEGPWEDKWEQDSDHSDSTTVSDVNEYEIDDFVVDSESDESEGSGDDEVENGDMGEEPWSDEIASSFNGFSPLQHEDEDEDLRNGEGLPPAHFSSLEPESPRTIASEDASDSEVQPVRMTKRSKRRILSSDDEEEDDDGHGEEPTKPVRPTKRARVVLSDSEDEDGAEEDAGRIRNGGPARKGDENSQESSDTNTEEEEDSDEEPVKPKKTSLLDKLRQFRSDNPISPSGSDGGSVASAGLEGKDYSDRADDDDEDDLDGEGDGMVADMAEEDFINDEDGDEW